MRKTLVAVAAVLSFGGAAVAGHAQAQSFPLCGGNQKIQQAPVTCTNSKTFTFGTLQRTVTIVLNVPADGKGSTVTYTLDKPVPQPFPIRVVAHEGTSGAGGAVDSDVSGTFPANSVGPVTLTFTVGCGQIDIKAVFTGNGQANGRVGGPYVCASQVVSTTTTPTTTVPATTVPGQTTVATTPTTAASATVSPATLPATGKGSNAAPVALVALALGGLLVYATRRRLA